MLDRSSHSDVLVLQSLSVFSSVAVSPLSALCVSLLSVSALAFSASLSDLIQFMMCLLMPVFTGKKYTPDSLDGKTKPKEDENFANPWAAGTVTAIRYVALLSLLGGTATVITGVILMTPETANGRGALPVVADGTLGVDLAPQPPGVNDIPGAKGAMKSVGKTVGGGVETVDGATS